MVFFPETPASAITFTDTDGDRNEITGTLFIDTPASEAATPIAHYRLP